MQSDNNVHNFGLVCLYQQKIREYIVTIETHKEGSTLLFFTLDAKLTHGVACLRAITHPMIEEQIPQSLVFRF